MVKFLASQNAMSINYQGRDGHTGETTSSSLQQLKMHEKLKIKHSIKFQNPALAALAVSLTCDEPLSPAQRLLPWPHPPGAVPAGQRGRHEPGCLRPEQVQRREGRADLPDVGL